jgi:hypothetical protein
MLISGQMLSQGNIRWCSWTLGIELLPSAMEGLSSTNENKFVSTACPAIFATRLS